MIKEFEGELLKMLDWNMMLSTTYDYADQFKKQGFLFSSDKIQGKFISNQPSVAKKANAYLDAIIEKLPHNPDFYQFYQSEVTMAAVLHVRWAMNLDEVCSEDMLNYICSDELDLPIIFQIEGLIHHSFPHVMEVSQQIPVAEASEISETQCCKVVTNHNESITFNLQEELRWLKGTKACHFVMIWPQHSVKVKQVASLNRYSFKTPRILPYVDEFDMSSEDSSI